jgi:DNA-directed RNA polymerase sigma subunit (sigma70/sigma32)
MAMTERSPRGKRGRTRVLTKTSLDPTEEKVIRMRHGLGAPDDMPLARVGQDRADVAEQLRQIELRALERSGRLHELQEEVGLEPVETNPAVKAKIIDRLKD